MFAKCVKFEFYSIGIFARLLLSDIVLKDAIKVYFD